MTRREQETALLHALFAAGRHPVAREDLAFLAQLPEEELEQVLAPYLAAGYPLLFHPHSDISLGEIPDIWCAEEILARCQDNVWNPLLLAETASTNDVARDQGRRGTPEGFVVAATRQTRGRGRLGRTWESPSHGGLYVSLLLRPQLAAVDAGRLTVLASVATADAVEALTGQRPQLKWPNDLMSSGRKLAGLLIETERSDQRLAFAVIGIGINVNQLEEDFSPEVRSRATSLRIETGIFYRRADLLVMLLQAFTRRLTLPFAETREAWAAASVTVGQQVRLTTLRGEKIGQAMGLDESGALLLRNEVGEIETITAGDMQAC